MKPWHLVVAVLYVLLLAVLVLPLAAGAAGHWLGSAALGELYGSAGLWLALLVLGAGQLLLLVVPVRLAHRRPVTRGPLWITVVVGAAMVALLGLGAASSLHAALLGDSELPWEPYAFGALVTVLWGLWAIVFGRLAGRHPPADFLSRLCRRLLQGSILELLVAVPCHVLVRQRHDCCAGAFTSFGLGLGIAVMLFSFGPAVYFLFVARARRLQPAPPSAPSTPETGYAP